MASRTHSVETQKDPSSKRKPQPSVVETPQVTPDVSTEAASSFSEGNVQSQAAMIEQAPGGLQQAMIGRIGKVQGNRHAQHLIASVQAYKKQQALENRIFAPRWATLPDPMQLLSMADAEKPTLALDPTQEFLPTEPQAPKEAKIQHSDVVGESKGAEKTSQAEMNENMGEWIDDAINGS